MNISFDRTNTLIGFAKSEDKMNFLTKKVHNELLRGDYIAKNSRKIVRSLKQLMAVNDKIAVTAFVPQLAVKLHVPDRLLRDFDEYAVNTNIADLLCNIWIDNGTLEEVTEGKVVFIDGRKVVIPVKYFQLGGEPTIKDLINGFSVMPGQLYRNYAGSVKMNSEAKSLLREVSSQPFQVSDYMTPELVMHGYKLMPDYWSDTREAGVDKRSRYALYLEAIKELKDMGTFYLPAYFDGRYRMYYEAQLLGIRPQGPLWETLMIDSDKPHFINEAGLNHIKHIIYVHRYGRCTLEYALEHFSVDDLVWADTQDPMSVNTAPSKATVAEFGKRILMNKAAAAIQLAWAGKPCNYLFGKDLTNSGLIMAGASFKSTDMSVWANLCDKNVCKDSHTGVIGDSGISRDVVKGINTALLHGGTFKVMAKDLSEALDREVPEDEVKSMVYGAYGSCVDNIQEIADWGSKIVDNYQTVIKWKTPDGFLAQSKAEMKHVPFGVYSARNNEQGYTKRVIVRTMPLAVDGKGYPIYAKGYGAGVHSDEGVVIKNRGLYANITHSLDGYLLRRIMRKLLASGVPFIMKHDDYMVPANAFDDVISEVKVFIKGATKMNYYQLCLNKIAEYSEGRAKYVPEIKLGDFEYNSESSNFLMP